MIRLDPGLAFGTGTHPTTRMCLGWLARARCGRGQARVLDYGCGSGILAIGAALHRRARRSTRWTSTRRRCRRREDNAAANGVHLRAGLPERASGRYDVVLANILATPLKLLAPLLIEHLAPAGSWCSPASWNARRMNCRRPMRRGWRCRSATARTAGS